MYGSETGPMKVEHRFTCVAYCYTYVNMSQIFLCRYANKVC